ncbi:MAG: hypothetical protein AB7E32_09025 [Desulfovibrio sp.]
MRDHIGPADASVSDRRFGFAAAAPLALAYILLPLAGAFARHFPVLRLPEWIPSGWPWLALAGVGLLAALAAQATRRKPLRPVPLWIGLVLVACGALLALSLIKLSVPRLQGPFFPSERFWILVLPETAPLAFLLLGLAWVLSFGAPARIWFARFGALLAALVLADVFYASLLAGFIVPGGVLLDPGLGERHALLLGLALLLGVDDPGRAGRFPSGWTLLSMGGFLCCGSPVPLLAVGAAYLFLARTRIEARIGFALACAGGVAGPLLGGTPLSMDGRMQVYMTWLAGLESFASHPLALFKGFGPWPLDLQLPAQAAVVMGMPDVAFTLPPHAVPSFWMRSALVWGALPPLVLLLLSIVLTAVTPGRAMAGIMALALTQGVVYSLLYDGSSGVTLGLAVACLLADGVPVLRAAEVAAETVAATTIKATVPAERDPARTPPEAD